MKSDKAFYDKKIIYLDYVEREKKIKNGGFLKWVVKDNEARIQIQIRGLYPTDTLQGELLLLADGISHPVDRISLHFGTGEYASVWKTDDLAGSGIRYEALNGILIRLSENRLLRGVWKEEVVDTGKNITRPVWEVVKRSEIVEVPTAVLTAAEEPKGEPDSIPVKKETEVDSIPVEAEKEVNSIPMEEEPKADSIPAKEDVKKAVLPVTEETGQMDREKKKSETVVLSGDKWEQLSRQYPKIHPFGDAREYLSIEPRDFVILSRQYHNLVQNSFLLHGYYNYGHVILTRIRENKEDVFYLGVPGVYFDREKQAALMFGFEGFEAGGDRVAEGGFGYYMKKVEI